MAKYIDIFTDYGFKKIFGEEANKNILIDFLNSILPENAHIKDLTFKNTEQLPISMLDRKAVYDIYCENDKGEKFIVELQKAKQNYFFDRTIYYSTFPISSQAQRGNWNYNLKAVYCIGLLDFKFNDYPTENDKYEVVHVHTLKNQYNEQVYKKLTYIYLEMPNFTKTENELVTRLDKWLYFIKNLEDFQSIPEIFKNEVVFVEAIEKAELSKMNEVDQRNYFVGLKAYRDYYASFETAQNDGREEGLKQGLEKGIEIGIEEGKEIGKQIGEEIGKEIGIKEEKIAIAKKALKKGMDIDDVIELTGLTEEEIKNIL